MFRTGKAKPNQLSQRVGHPSTKVANIPKTRYVVGERVYDVRAVFQALVRNILKEVEREMRRMDPSVTLQWQGLEIRRRKGFDIFWAVDDQSYRATRGCT